MIFDGSTADRAIRPKPSQMRQHLQFLEQATKGRCRKWPEWDHWNKVADQPGCPTSLFPGECSGAPAPVGHSE